MEKINQKDLLIEIAEQNKDIIYKDNKVMARTSWIRLWDKNPKMVEDKNLKRLKNQIETLGVYKPLVISAYKDNAIVLGGNQRFKVLSELSKKDKKYEYVWVSIVNAKTDEDRLKYAISDNDQIGEYTREQLKDVLQPFFEQGSLFEDYSLDINKGVEQFIAELPMDENKVRFQAVEKELKSLGVNTETLNVLEDIVVENKKNEDLPDVDIQGKIEKKKFPVIFWFEDEILHEQIRKIYGLERKYHYSTEKFVEFTEAQIGENLPVSEDKLLEILMKIEEKEEDLKNADELGGNTEKISNEIESKRKKAKELYNKLFNI